MRRILVSILALAALAASANGADQVVSDPGDNGGANQLRAKLTAAQASGGGNITFNIGPATISHAHSYLVADFQPNSHTWWNTYTYAGHAR